MTNHNNETAIGTIKLSSRRNLTKQEREERNLETMSSWYDHGYEVFEITGEMDLCRIQSALHHKFYRPSYGKFGGGISIGKVEKFDDNHVLVEFIYHIGD